MELYIFFSFAAHFKPSSSTTSWELRQQFAACSGCVNSGMKVQATNCFRNSWLVVDEDDLKWVKN